MIGLEERFLGIFQEGEISTDKYLFFINKEYGEDERVKKNKKEIDKRYLKGVKYKLLDASYLDPFIIIREFNKFIKEERLEYDTSKIIFDISTFNRQNLIVILRLLRMIPQVTDIELVYTIPQEVNQVISKGGAGFSNIPFFSGNFSIHKKKMLILLIGYEVDRPLILWSELEPSRVILVEGYEPTSGDFYETNKTAVEEVSKYGNNDMLRISANDPYKARDQLNEIIKKESQNYNIFISPLNTKLQAVGLYLAWENNPDVQIVIAFPDRFSDWLSRGIKEIMRFKL